MTDLVLVFLLVFVAFNKIVRNSVSAAVDGGEGGGLAVAHALPICLVVFFLYRIVCPYSASRRAWLHTLWRVLAAPCYQIVFRDGYIGDLLTSLVRVLVPLSYSLTYLGVSVYAWLANDMALASSTSDHWWKDSPFFRLGLVPFLTLLPLWLRLVQCLRRSVESGKRWPHMGNALKYTSAILVISYGTFQPSVRKSAVWVAAFVGATLFQFAWDLTQDWGMVEVSSAFQRHSSSADVRQEAAVESYALDYISNLQVKLRDQRLLGPAWVYLLVIAGNLVLRFAWTLTLLPASAAQSAEVSPVYFSFLTHVGPLIAAGEILRRMVWGFFRLEFEQLEVLARRHQAPSEGEEEDEEEDEEAAALPAESAEDASVSFAKVSVLLLACVSAAC